MYIYIYIYMYVAKKKHKKIEASQHFWDCGSSKTSKEHWQTRRGERWVNGGSTIYICICIYVCTDIICVFS